MGTRSLTMTPADILKYQEEQVRTGNCLPLGRMQKIAIGPAAGFVPPPNDPVIAKFGRLIELRDRFLPIAFSMDRSMVLCTAPLVDRNNRVCLPDVPDPNWLPRARTNEEIQGRTVKEGGPEHTEWMKINRPGARPPAPTGREISLPVEITNDVVRMVPQRLEDRTNEILEGTNFLVFSPVEKITFQPEIEGRLQGTAWWIDCKPEPNGTRTAFLVDRATGQAHFFGGLYDVGAPAG